MEIRTPEMLLMRARKSSEGISSPTDFPLPKSVQVSPSVSTADLLPVYLAAEVPLPPSVDDLSSTAEQTQEDVPTAFPSDIAPASSEQQDLTPPAAPSESLIEDRLQPSTSGPADDPVMLAVAVEVASALPIHVSPSAPSDGEVASETGSDTRGIEQSPVEPEEPPSLPALVVASEVVSKLPIETAPKPDIIEKESHEESQTEGTNPVILVTEEGSDVNADVVTEEVVPSEPALPFVDASTVPTPSHSIYASEGFFDLPSHVSLASYGSSYLTPSPSPSPSAFLQGDNQTSNSKSIDSISSKSPAQISTLSASAPTFFSNLFLPSIFRPLSSSRLGITNPGTSLLTWYLKRTIV